MGRIIGFGIWVLTCLIFVGIGIWAWQAKEPVGFFTHAPATKVRDVKKYNRAVAKLWFFFAGGMLLLGLPLLAGQNSPLIVISIIGSLFLVIAIAVIYIRIEQKYKVD